MEKNQIEEFAYEIRDFLLKHGIWIDVTIYFNGKALSTSDKNGHYAYNDPDVVFVLEDQDPKKYFDYVGDILSMSFEGDLYEIMNYGSNMKVLAEFDELFRKHGLYYELGNAWNLTAYPI